MPEDNKLNFVPRVHNGGALGKIDKQWSEVHAERIYVDGKPLSDYAEVISGLQVKIIQLEERIETLHAIEPYEPMIIGLIEEVEAVREAWSEAVSQRNTTETELRTLVQICTELSALIQAQERRVEIELKGDLRSTTQMLNEVASIQQEYTTDFELWSSLQADIVSIIGLINSATANIEIANDGHRSVEVLMGHYKAYINSDDAEIRSRFLEAYQVFNPAWDGQEASIPQTVLGDIENARSNYIHQIVENTAQLNTLQDQRQEKQHEKSVVSNSLVNKISQIMNLILGDGIQFIGLTGIADKHTPGLLPDGVSWAQIEPDTVIDPDSITDDYHFLTIAPNHQIFNDLKTVLEQEIAISLSDINIKKAELESKEAERQEKIEERDQAVYEVQLRHDTFVSMQQMFSNAVQGMFGGQAPQPQE
ncbi:MAG: hypothetical protein CME70_06005 [Halobacteriovorax sp.]|nr:hypothetical protein [Halobacteriovorax sp.]